MKILFLLAPIVLLASCTLGNTPAVTSPTPQKPVQTVTPNDAMKKDDSVMKKEDTMMKTDSPAMKKDDTMLKSDTSMKKDDAMMMKKEEPKTVGPTGYSEYDESKVKVALAAGQKVALFFNAPWCPSCRNLDEEIKNNMSAIPADTLIVKVDYDSSSELKAKYGVRSQHTTVLIDKDQNLISKKQGAQNIAEILG